VALHHPGPACQGEEVRHPVRDLVDPALHLRGRDRHAHVPAGPALPHRRGRAQPPDDLQSRQVPQPDPADDRGLRRGVRVPGGPRVPRAGRGPQHRPAQEVATPRHRRDLRHRRGHHAEPGPVLAVRHGDPDVPVLRGVHPHRAVAQEVSEDAGAIRSAFESGLGFDLDGFQVRAFDALDEGHSVLVAAPTGSGKTVVAEYAVDRAIHEGRKAFYTTPLKALSNQKYGDLVRRYGVERVGLLTGDNAINGDAPVVVMTTEVLRNMIYAGSSALEGLRYVVLDEVHYLQNPYRGAVWEEVIIHAPPEIDLVCLSATVSNAEEFAEWIQTVRGTTTAIIEERRPIELENLYMVGDRGTEKVHLLPTFVDGRPNPEASNLDDRAFIGTAGRGRARRRLFTPRRTEVVEDLRDRTMLPAIYFIFSRAGCDEAVARCLQEGVRLTTPEERTEIRAIVESKVEVMSDADLALLDYAPWLAGLEAGLAAHHAGLVPPFKEAVEACFERALVKVVFATETLSLGINMPARTVVIEKLTKFTGERHEHLTPGEYTQLTGRAGRRGIDDRGYAVVLWSPW